MKRSHFVLSALCILSLTLLITACGGGSPTRSTGNGGTSKPSVTTSSVPTGTVGTAYSATLQASGGTAPYKWSLKSGGLPTGISLSVDGTLSGTPSAVGTADSLVFQVTDAGNNSASSSNLSLKVNPEAPPVVQTATLQDGNVGVGYSTTLTATGGTKPYTWSVTGTCRQAWSWTRTRVRSPAHPRRQELRARWSLVSPTSTTPLEFPAPLASRSILSFK
ncbi:MAG: putative Ig domain-containing protein [Candidatus Sulfotelmatobacter sp.]